MNNNGKKRLECDQAKDLIPLAADGQAAAQNCQRSMNNSHMWLLFGAAAVGIALFALFAVFVWLFFFGGFPDIVKGADNYPSEINRLVNLKTGCVHTGFICFPEELPEGISDNDAVFYSFYQDTLFDPTNEVFLEVKYGAEDYAAEVNRLENTCKTYAYERRTLLRGDKNYPYPAYVAIDGSNYTLEYAMLTGNNRIAYIYLSFMSNPKKLRAVPVEYLPADYAAKMSSLRFDAYNIYVIPQISNDEAHAYDYSRKSLETVEDWHVVAINENDMFSVCTLHYPDRSELVNYCVHRRSDMKSDEDIIVNGDCLPEAHGKQFVAARLDGNRVILTCSDESGEKEYFYKIN